MSNNHDPFAGFGLPPISDTPDTTLDRMVESAVLSKKQKKTSTATVTGAEPRTGNILRSSIPATPTPVTTTAPPVLSLFKPKREEPIVAQKHNAADELTSSSSSEDDNDQPSLNLDSGEPVTLQQHSSPKQHKEPSVITNRKRSGLGEPIHILPFSMNDGVEMPITLDWRKFYLDHRVRLEKKRELLPLDETREMMRARLESIVTSWQSSSFLHQRKCPPALEKVFQRLPPHESDTMSIMLSTRLEKFTCRVEDLAFEPLRNYAVDYESWSKITCNTPEEIAPYKGNNSADELLHFLLPFAPEVELQLLQSSPSDTIWNQATKATATEAAKLIDPLDTRPYHALLSFDALSNASSQCVAFEKMSDLWTGPSFRPLEHLTPPMVFVGDKQIGEITGMNLQNIRGSQFRAIVMLIGQLEALTLPSLRTLLVSEAKEDVSFDSCVFTKTENPSRYFPSDDAYRFFVYQHAYVLNAILAEELHRLMDKILPAKLLEELTAETGAASKDHILKFVRNYISFRYVYVHRLVACCSAFYDYLFNPGMNRLLLQNLSINMQSTASASAVSKKVARAQISRTGALFTNPAIYHKIKKDLLDTSQEPKLRLAPFRLHAIAILRAYHTQSKFGKTNEDRSQKLVMSDQIPVGMLLEKPSWRRIGSAEDSRVRKDQFCVWTLQPLTTCCMMEAEYEDEMVRSPGETTQPWIMWDKCLRVQAYQHGTIKLSKAGATWMRPHIPAIASILNEQTTLIAWGGEKASDWQSGHIGKQLLSALIAYYNHLKGETIFQISSYGIGVLSRLVHAETETTRRNVRYVVNSDSEFHKWLNGRSLTAVIEEEIKKQKAEKDRKAAAEAVNQARIEDAIEAGIERGQIKAPRKKRSAPGELTEEAKLAKQDDRKIYMRLYQRERRKQKALEKGKIFKPRGENKRKKQECTMWRVRTGIEGEDEEEPNDADQIPVTDFE